ncbi:MULTISPECIES: hypothetical protein [Stutzerimonas]|jgi:hypothetical protein|uniref:Transposase n=1 Tax=Stutzerimonas stutzeri (strain A1501) TaxID=379731 RepID=A4VQ35_STUS1|nr:MULTISPECIES: hypothetical protein [Stutzerimonas]ABP81086.1 conserved hypothetical protein [Stutzerimonas stutzeri A1501]MCQ2045099.1 hypothetical protein [Stutzerimonas kunmingensis]SFK07818.1 hypothetical protein SAMN05216194_1144 [Stutzerimonas kunmingensis]
MMRPDAKVQKVYLYPKPVGFRKSINGLAALVELNIKVERLRSFQRTTRLKSSSAHAAPEQPATAE